MSRISFHSLAPEGRSALLPYMVARSRLEVLAIRGSTSTLDSLVEAFRARAGRAPEGVWFAPGRVNLIGEHTDYSDGFVLPVAIDRGVLVAAAPRDDGRLRCWSLQAPEAADLRLEEIGPGRVEGWAAYPAGVAWALTGPGSAAGPGTAVAGPRALGGAGADAGPPF